MIYHVTYNKDWAIAKERGFYHSFSLDTEGFIHCSTSAQVAGVLDRYYKDRNDLLLLHIDENLLTSRLEYEHSPSLNQKFPHVFGDINLDAIIDIEEL